MNTAKLTFIILIISFLLPLFADKVQNFTAEDINGNRITLYEYLEKGPVIIDFWATWCKPCLKSLPHLNKIHQGHEKITVIAVSVDKARKAGEVTSTVKSNRYEFIVIHDTAKQLQKLMNVSMVPRTFVINPQGEIVLNHNTYNLGDEIEIEEAAIESMKIPETESEIKNGEDCNQK